MYFSSLQHVGELPDSLYLMSVDRSNWPRCLLWHGWLPGLSGISDKDLWATSFGDFVSCHLERCLGAYPVDFDGCWTPPEYWDADDISLETKTSRKFQNLQNQKFKKSKKSKMAKKTKTVKKW